MTKEDATYQQGYDRGFALGVNHAMSELAKALEEYTRKYAIPYVFPPNPGLSVHDSVEYNKECLTLLLNSRETLTVTTTYNTLSSDMGPDGRCVRCGTAIGTTDGQCPNPDCRK